MAISRSKKSRLLVEERRRRIMEILEAQERVTVDELVARFSVSAVTIRGDLDALAEAGSVIRSHGGALKRIDAGTYGVCEMSGKQIAHARLEAIPFARYTVECQAQIEKQNKVQRTRTPVTSLFGLTDDEGGGEGDEEETATDNKEDKE